MRFSGGKVLRLLFGYIRSFLGGNPDGIKVSPFKGKTLGSPPLLGPPTARYSAGLNPIGLEKSYERPYIPPRTFWSLDPTPPQREMIIPHPFQRRGWQRSLAS